MLGLPEHNTASAESGSYVDMRDPPFVSAEVGSMHDDRCCSIASLIVL
jgi:hypothetical protein